ncbi:IS630 family transposase, partial [Deinococcus sp.]|uniref:IS630 family transposase n=1 Tax=Deinococcus sp. TaxID=47478 RepID=UPI0025BCE96E
MTPVVGNTWATRGQTPVIFAKTNWKKLSVIGGITSEGQFFQQTHEGSIKAAGFIAFLSHLLRHIKGKVTVVVDNAKIHKAKAVSAFLAEHQRLSLTYLPAYSPELNPIELVWAYVKRHHL